MTTPGMTIMAPPSIPCSFNFTPVIASTGGGVSSRSATRVTNALSLPPDQALSTDYDRDNAPSVASWLSTLFEPLPDEGEETDVDRELADLLEEPEVSAALYPRQMRSLH